MRAIVVYESLWGNTEKIARAIAHALEPALSVKLFDSDSAPSSVVDYDLVIVGGPTHAMSMSRPSTRAVAHADHAAPHVPARGIREWLNILEAVSPAISAATFDTRVNMPRIPGSAAKAARHELRSLGFDVTAKAESFRVHGYEGPLISWEEERAADWALALVPQGAP